MWLVTGAGRGIGRAVVDAALAAGDRVIATVRRADALDELHATHPEQLISMVLDVRDRARVLEVVDDAAGRFGALDVVVNNAGYGLVGAAEEVSEPEAREIIDTNFFAAPRRAYDAARLAVLGTAEVPWDMAAAGATTEAPPRVAAAAIVEHVRSGDDRLRLLVGDNSAMYVALALDARRLDYARDARFTWPADH